MNVSIWVIIGVYVAASVILGLTDEDCREALFMMMLLPLFPVLLVGSFLSKKGMGTYTVDPDEAASTVKWWLSRGRNRVRVLAMTPRLIVLVGKQSKPVRAEGTES